jgi:hypothetical protein
MKKRLLLVIDWVLSALACIFIIAAFYTGDYEFFWCAAPLVVVVVVFEVIRTKGSRER